MGYGVLCWMMPVGSDEIYIVAYLRHVRAVASRHAPTIAQQ
jgi:hypothetical protein